MFIRPGFLSTLGGKPKQNVNTSINPIGDPGFFSSVTNMFGSQDGLKGDIFTDDFRKNVLKGSLNESDMPEEEKKKILAHLDAEKPAPKSTNSPKRGPIKPLSVRRAVKDSIDIIRGKAPNGF